MFALDLSKFIIIVFAHWCPNHLGIPVCVYSVCVCVCVCVCAMDKDVLLAFCWGVVVSCGGVGSVLWGCVVVSCWECGSVLLGVCPVGSVWYRLIRKHIVIVCYHSYHGQPALFYVVLL